MGPALRGTKPSVGWIGSSRDVWIAGLRAGNQVARYMTWASEEPRPRLRTKADRLRFRFRTSDCYWTGQETSVFQSLESGTVVGSVMYVSQGAPEAANPWPSIQL